MDNASLMLWLEEFIARGDTAWEWFSCSEPRPFHNIRNERFTEAIQFLAYLEPHLTKYGDMKYHELSRVEKSRLVVEFARRIIEEKLSDTVAVSV